MANRDDRVARLRAVAAVWLRSPRLWRGLLVAGLVVGAFGWAVTVLGIALAMAQEGAEQWWLVLVFGLATLALVIGGAYLLITRLFGSPSRPPVDQPGRGSGAVGTSRSTVAAAPPPPGPPPATGEPLEPLSQRELEVLQLLATGRSNREIATELYVATGTVKAHLNNIFRKLEARSRLEAVTRARDLRLLAERDPK
jgi:DNA-binding CsgD family transcriptional regulator